MFTTVVYVIREKILLLVLEWIFLKTKPTRADIENIV